MVDLCLLRSCRQVYNEAHFIPYSANTFSCFGPETLQKFVLSIARGPKGNHLAIRSLFLDMALDNFFWGSLWKKAVSTCVREFKALQKVSISIGLRSWSCLQSNGDLTSDSKRCSDTLVSAIRGLKRLPLKTATMIISDKEFEKHCNVYGTTHLWTPYRISLDEKRKVACDLRECILQSSR